MITDVNAVAEVARRLSQAGEAIGARVRIGVCDHYQACGYLFAVLNHRGETLALAHDAFEAARWFVGVENQLEWEEWEDDAHPTVSLPSDVELEATAFAHRRARYRRLSGTWTMIDINRERRRGWSHRPTLASTPAYAFGARP